MTSPAVSIIVRTKDRPVFLARALHDLAAQTFDRWECVIVNDGGAVAPVEDLVASLASDVRERVRAVHHGAPRGRWTSANAGVLATSAPLLVLHDDDDTWHPEFLERAVDYLDRHPERDGIVSRTEIVWERREGPGFHVERRELFQPQLHDLLLSDALLFNRYVPIGFLYRRSLHEELGLYDDSLPVVGDWAFNLRVLRRGPLEYLGSQPYAFWHQRTDGAGVDGNSVIDASSDHERYDALIRDAALRQDLDSVGLGTLLYLTKFIDRRFVEVENGIRDEIAQKRPADYLAARLLGWAHRLPGRGPRC